VLTKRGSVQAHSTGLYGENGRGLCDALGLNERMTVRVHTFGKAMACSGGTSPTLSSLLSPEKRVFKRVIELQRWFSQVH